MINESNRRDDLSADRDQRQHARNEKDEAINEAKRAENRQASSEQYRESDIQRGSMQSQHVQQSASEGSGQSDQETARSETYKEEPKGDHEDTQSSQSEDPTRKNEANQGVSDLRTRQDTNTPSDENQEKRNPEERRDASDKGPTNDFREREKD